MKYLQESRDDETDSQMGENTCIVGKVKYRVVNIEVQTALNGAGARLESEELPVFVKMKKNNVIYHSSYLLNRKEQEIARSACSLILQQGKFALD